MADFIPQGTMAKNSNDWRETDRRLNELPDEQLRTALQAAGVKAVLPSHKKPRSAVKPAGQMGDATARWAAGDWQERISLEELPDAQKFLEDPSKPPTIAMRQTLTPLAASHAPSSRPLRGLVWGLAATAAVMALALIALGGQELLERPQISARTPVAESEPVARASSAPRELDSAAVADQPERVTPAGSPHAPEAARPDSEHREQYLMERANEGDAAAMVALARAAIERREPRNAIKWANMAKDADRTSIEARVVLGDAQMLAGRRKLAYRTWRAALARAPQSEELRQRLGK